MNTLTIFGKEEPKTYDDSDFPTDLYKANQPGLFYCRTLSHSFNGPFYGFTRDSDPGEFGFVPELFFLHGPTFIIDGTDGHCHLKTLLSDSDALKRLTECIEKVLEVRHSDPFHNPYEVNFYSYTRAVKIQYGVARDFQNELFERLSSDITVWQYNDLMGEYDDLTKELRNACEQRDRFIQVQSIQKWLEKEVEKLCPVSLNKMMDMVNALKDKFSEIRLKTNKDMELTNEAIKSNHKMSSKVDNLNKELKEIPDFVKDLVRGEVKELVSDDLLKEIVREVLKEEMQKEVMNGKQRKTPEKPRSPAKPKKAPEKKPAVKPVKPATITDHF